jgi:hypothetical protein
VVSASTETSSGAGSNIHIPFLRNSPYGFTVKEGYNLLRASYKSNDLIPTTLEIILLENPPYTYSNILVWQRIGLIG